MVFNIKAVSLFIFSAAIPVVYLYTPIQYSYSPQKSGSYLIQPKLPFDDSTYQLVPIGDHRFENPVGAACFSEGDQSFLVAEADGRIYKVWTEKDDVVRTKQIHALNPDHTSGASAFEIFDIKCHSEYLSNSKREILLLVRGSGANRRPILVYNGELDDSNENLGDLLTNKPTIVIKNTVASQSSPGVIFGVNGSIILSFQTSLDGFLTSQEPGNFRGKIIALRPQTAAENHQSCVIVFSSSFGPTETSDCGTVQVLASGNSRPLAMQLSNDSRVLQVLDKQIEFGLEFNEVSLGESVNFGWPYVAGYGMFRKTAVDTSNLTSPINYYLLEKGKISSASFIPDDQPTEFRNRILFTLVKQEGPSLYAANSKTNQIIELNLPNLGRKPVKISSVGKMIVLTSSNSSLAILVPKGQETQFSNAAIESKYLFSQYCEYCHGPQGKSFLIGISELKEGKWTEGQNSVSLASTISKGIAHKMPAFSTVLTDRQIKGLALYVQSFDR